MAAYLMSDVQVEESRLWQLRRGCVDQQLSQYVGCVNVFPVHVDSDVSICSNSIAQFLGFECLADAGAVRLDHSHRAPVVHKGHMS